MVRILSFLTTLFMSVAITVNSYSSPHFPRFWNWLTTHSIIPHSPEHIDHMFNNWVNNDLFISETNDKNLSYRLAHNAFSGMNNTEFYEHMGFNRNKDIVNFNTQNLRVNEARLLSELPTSIDWRLYGVVTTVKDQGQCGSCYSFSNTGALEGAYAIKYGTLKSFSEQEIVDCSKLALGGPNMGCNGGQIGATMDWIGKVNGLCSETDYPYTSGTTKTAGTCQNTCSPVQGTKVLSHTAVQKNSDVAMMTALSKQPVSVAVEADQPAFQFYSSGVFTQSCGTNLDHAVLLVGYGTMNGNDYYIMKNSWGYNWGSQGYMYLGRGPQYNGGQGQCGVLMEAAYPNL
jgi:C1A family cysteine protease